MAAQMMRFYSMSHSELLALPIYTFWELSRNIDRVRADEDRRLLIVVAQAFGGDPNEHMRALTKEIGSVAETDEERFDDEFDREGFNQLRALLGQ